MGYDPTYQGNALFNFYYHNAGYYYLPDQKFYRKAGLHTGCMQLVRETIEEMADNGVVITSTTEYDYESWAPYRAIASTKNTSDGNSIATQILYPQNYATGGFISTLLAKNMVAAPVETIVRRNGKIISGSYFSYDSKGNVAGVYKLEESNISESSFRLSNKSAAESYTNTQGMSFNPDVRYKLNTSIIYHAVNNKPVQITDKAGRSLNGLRANPELSDAVVTLYKYLPLFGISEIINPRGSITNYGYDLYGQLMVIEERRSETAAKNTLQFFEYNYRNQ